MSISSPQPLDVQQAHSISELARLNAATDNLLQEQPSLEALYQQQLASFFPELPQPINPNTIFYSRYREVPQGTTQLLSSEPLGALLMKLRAPDAQAYLAQETGAFFREGHTLETQKRLSTTSPTATMAGALEIALTVKLNEFWREQTGDQPHVEDQLIALLREALAQQLTLRTLGATLSATARALADRAINGPRPATQALPADSQPGTYRLTLEDGSHFVGAFIISATPVTPPEGNVMLYTPGEGFEAFEHLARLNETVAARLRDGGPASTRLAASLSATARAGLGSSPRLATRPPLIDTDVVTDSVRSLRAWQYVNVREALRQDTLPVIGELDLAADVTPILDISGALASHTLRLIEGRDADWLRAAPPVDQALYKQLDTALTDSNELLIPELERISTLTAFAERETLKVLKLQKPQLANVNVAPYKSLVQLRLTNSAPAPVNGYRDARTGTVYISEDPKINIPHFLKGRPLTRGSWSTQVVVDLRTLGSYTRRNVDPWSPHEVHRTITASATIIDTSGMNHGKLDDADLRALARQANIGHHYGEYLKLAFAPDGAGSAFASAWQRTNALKMKKDALESRLNPAVYDRFTFKVPGSGLDWIDAITQYPNSATRPPVGRFEIEANHLAMGSGLASGRGGQVINGVLVIRRKGSRADAVSVLYTPDAPDGAPFRELVNGLSELDALVTTPQWRSYFTERMATSDTEELARIFGDTRSALRYTVTLITDDLQAYLYSAQLGFQLAHADYRSRSNAQISRESLINAVMFGVEVVDVLIDWVPAKTALSFLRRGITRGLNTAQKLGRRIPVLIKKTTGNQKNLFVIAESAIRPLEPAWVDVASYRLPKSIDPLFDVEAFASTHDYTLSRSLGAPSFIDNRNNQFIAMRDNHGRYYLYPSYVEDGTRYVKDPIGNKTDFIVVPGDAKSWKPRFEDRARGGGQAVSALRPRTAEQQVEDDLIEALRVYSSADELRSAMDTLRELTPAQKQSLLSSTRQQLGIDEATFRQRVAGQRHLSEQAKRQLRMALLGLVVDTDIYTHINRSTKLLSLSPGEKDQVHLRVKRIIGKNDNFSKYIRSSISIKDPDTGAQFVGYAVTNKQMTDLTRFDQKYKLSSWSHDSLNAFIRAKGRQQVLNRIVSERNITREAALEQLLSAPSIQDALVTFRTELFKTRLNDLGVESFSDDFKKSGIPYIALSNAENTAGVSGVNMVDSVTVAAFEKNIPQFSTPLELTPGRAQTHRVERPSTRPSPSTPPESTAAHDDVVNLVRLDELAQTQYPLLPSSARRKIDEIIQDIQAGRVSRKKIGNYTYVDLPQVEAGAGRGRWRAAFEKVGREDDKDIFILRGILDYHASKLQVWGM